MSNGDPWSKSTYDRVTRRKIDSGTAFQYTRSSKSAGVWEAHDNLKVLTPNGEPVTRESRDSDRYPVTTPIVVGFDVTGSMDENPAILQSSLKGLMGMIDRKGLVSGPQIAIAAYGDTNGDYVPVQLSQFECDNLIDENLDNVFIEGHGCGNGGETSTALAWFVARHVVTDAWEKRGKRGYMFLIGDECALSVQPDESKRFLGEPEPRLITPEDAFSAATERWDVYFLVVNNWSAQYQDSVRKYKDLLGDDHVIVLESTESAPAVIASVIALTEGTMDRSEMACELEDAGFGAETALAAVNATANVGGNSIAKVSYADLGL